MSAGTGLRRRLVLPARPAAFQTIAVAVELENVHMISEPVEQGSRKPLGPDAVMTPPFSIAWYVAGEHEVE
jgi:hypothetical protein